MKRATWMLLGLTYATLVFQKVEDEQNAVAAIFFEGDEAVFYID